MPVFNLKSPDMKECHATRLLITGNISVGVIDRDRLTCHDDIMMISVCTLLSTILRSAKTLKVT